LEHHVESPDLKRSRLREELRQAYADWLAASVGAIDTTAIDTTGCADGNKARWFAYQAARMRLVEAYAEPFE
jgi:hypothetical protein